jgi:hypothetical protein
MTISSPAAISRASAWLSEKQSVVMFWPNEISRPLGAPRKAATVSRVASRRRSVSREVGNSPWRLAFEVR